MIEKTAVCSIFRKTALYTADILLQYIPRAYGDSGRDVILYTRAKWKVFEYSACDTAAVALDKK